MLEPTIGTQLEAEPGADATSGLHLDLSARTMFENNWFGLYTKGAYDHYKGNSYVVDGYKLEVGPTVNAGRLLKFEKFTNNFTWFVHTGIGATYFDTSNYDHVAFNLSVGLYGLYRLNNNLAIKAGWTRTGNIAQQHAFDGVSRINSHGVDSFVDAFSVGLSITLKKNRDWKTSKESIVATTPYVEFNDLRNKVDSLQKPAPIYNIEQGGCDCDFYETVFFEHDKYDILQSEQHPIDKAVNAINKNDQKTITVIGWASPTQSDQAYNLELSKKRAEGVAEDLILLGVKKELITIEYKGKDYNYGNERLHKYARRVDILIK